MKTAWLPGLMLLSGLLIAVSPNLLAVSPKYQDAAKARIENGYAVVLFENGSKTMVPLKDLDEEDRAWLVKLSAESPLAHGNSAVRVVKEEVQAVKTITT